MVLSLIGAWIWLLWSGGVWTDHGKQSHYAGSMQLSFIPLHLAGSIVMTVSSALIACMCCCVGKPAVDMYRMSSLSTAVLAALRFCGACGFIYALVHGGKEADCEAARMYRYEQDYRECCRGCECAMIASAYAPVSCDEDPFEQTEKIPMLIFVLLPWAAWCTTMLLVRSCGWSCFARQWSQTASAHGTHAVLPVATVSVAHLAP